MGVNYLTTLLVTSLALLTSARVALEQTLLAVQSTIDTPPRIIDPNFLVCVGRDGVVLDGGSHLSEDLGREEGAVGIGERFSLSEDEERLLGLLGGLQKSVKSP